MCKITREVLVATFNYASAGELYYPRTPGIRNHPRMTYRRFANAGEAIRFAMEDITPPALQGCCLEVEGERYTHNQMRELYESEEFVQIQKGKTKK